MTNLCDGGSHRHSWHYGREFHFHAATHLNTSVVTFPCFSLVQCSLYGYTVKNAHMSSPKPISELRSMIIRYNVSPDTDEWAVHFNPKASWEGTVMA